MNSAATSPRGTTSSPASGQPDPLGAARRLFEEGSAAGAARVLHHAREVARVQARVDVLAQIDDMVDDMRAELGGAEREAFDEVLEHGGFTDREIGQWWSTASVPLVLGSLALLDLGATLLAVLGVYAVLPAIFGVEWSCVLSGPSTAAAEAYALGMAVVGVTSLVAVLATQVRGVIRTRRRVAAWLPLAWLAAVIVVSVVFAIVIGPQACADEPWFGL